MTIAFGFIVSIFYVKFFIHLLLFYQSIPSPTICPSFVGSHFDNHDDGGANNNDTSNGKRRQHLLSASGQTGTFLNALQI